MLNAIIYRYQAAYSGLPANVWLMSVILLINRSGTMMLPFLGLYLTDKLEMPESEFGKLLSLYGMGGIAGAYLGGWFTRRVGSIRTMIFCMLASIPFYFLVGTQTDPFILAFILPMMALPVEAARPATTAATTDLCPKRLHTKALALNRMAVNLGMAIGPVLGGAVYHWGFIYLTSINAAMTLISSLILVIVFPKVLPFVDVEIEPLRPPATDTPWRDPIYLSLLTINVITGLIFFQIMGTFSIYLRDDFGWREFPLGALLAINTVVIVIAEMVLVDYLKQFNYLRVIGWGCLAVGLGFGVIAFSGNLWIAILSVLLWTLGEMLTMPLSVAFASRRSSNYSRSAYLAAYSMSFSVCLVLAPLIGTQLYEIDHKLPWLLALIVSPVLLVACYLLAIWESNEQRSADAEKVKAVSIASSGDSATEELKHESTPV